MICELRQADNKPLTPKNTKQQNNAQSRHSRESKPEKEGKHGNHLDGAQADLPGNLFHRATVTSTCNNVPKPVSKWHARDVQQMEGKKLALMRSQSSWSARKPADSTCSCRHSTLDKLADDTSARSKYDAAHWPRHCA